MNTSKLVALAATLVLTTCIFNNGRAEGEAEVKVETPAKDTIGITLELWHDKTFDKEKYAKLMNHIYGLVQICEQQSGQEDEAKIRTVINLLGNHSKLFWRAFQKTLPKNGELMEI